MSGSDGCPRLPPPREPEGRGLLERGLDAAAPEPLWKIDLTVPVALVLGSEGTGLHRLVRQKCDLLASLPITGRVGSYNVSVAAGISCTRYSASGPKN